MRVSLNLAHFKIGTNRKQLEHGDFSFDIYMFNVNNGNIRTVYEIRLKLTMKTPE